MDYKVGIIGCGLIGNKRAESLEKFPNTQLVKVCDINANLAEELAKKYCCRYTTDWKQVVNDKDINLVIIAVTHNLLAKMTIAALARKKHVLVEKPAGTNVKEIKAIVDIYEKMGKKYKIKVGFNHRFHPSFVKAKEIIEKEDIGEIMFIRAVYGHGGRLGYEKEWRARKSVSGGGELVDQGSHLIELSKYFLGDSETAVGYCDTFFWDIDVEDNCFMLLRTKKGQISQLHASWTHWKNTFSMDIMCEKGQLSIKGLGGSYDTETLTFYKMKTAMGVPDRFTYEWNGEDASWEQEYAHFISCIEQNIETNGSIYDALYGMKLIQEIYKWSDRNG